MLSQNAQNTSDRRARRIASERRATHWDAQNEGALRSMDRDWSDEPDDDDPDSVLGVQVSIVDALRSIQAAGAACGHGGAGAIARASGDAVRGHAGCAAAGSSSIKER